MSNKNNEVFTDQNTSTNLIGQLKDEIGSTFKEPSLIQLCE
jgi:hypothetical protein